MSGYAFDNMEDLQRNRDLERDGTELGLPGGRGLMDALADPAIDVADCVIGTDIAGLWVLGVLAEIVVFALSPRFTLAPATLVVIGALVFFASTKFKQ